MKIPMKIIRQGVSMPKIFSMEKVKVLSKIRKLDISHLASIASVTYSFSIDCKHTRRRMSA
jgi:hypothetical protein